MIVEKILKYLFQLMWTEIRNKWLQLTSCKTFSSDTFIAFIVDQYRAEVDKTNKPKHTNFMISLFHNMCRWSKVKDTRKKALKSLLDKKIMNVRIQANLRTKPARTYPPIDLLNLIQDQWKRPMHGLGQKAILRKYTSAMALICFLTGRRWVDITRIKWDNLDIIETPLGIFYKFYIPSSKTNIRGQRIECVTIRNVQSESFIGPIKMLESIRHWQGGPSKGFVFPCVHRKRKFVKDPIWEPWSSYRCDGHWVNNTKAECLGQIDGKVTIGVLQRFALKQGWTSVPTKHTFRRLVTLLHKRQGLTREQINEIMGWVPTSNMPVHYAAEQDSLLKTAPAFVFAKELESLKPFHQFNDIQFKL